MQGKIKLRMLILIFALISLGLAVGLSVSHMLGDPFAWGHGKLTVSERTYYKNRFEKITQQWGGSPKSVERNDEGVLTGDYDVYLVIDTNKPGMWIEDKGVVQQDYYMDLPEGMKWQFYRCFATGKEDLPAKVRFKIRGYYSSRVYPEKICLHGHGRSFDHLSFYITSRNGSSDYGGSRYKVQQFGGSYDEDKEYYDSIVVSETEYAQFLESIGNEGLGGKSGEGYKAIEDANVSRWLGIEKRLYQQIEEQVSWSEYVLDKLVVSDGGDYTRAFAKIEADYEEGLLDFIRPRYRHFREAECRLRIDYLGESIWYAKSIPSFEWNKRMQSLDLEFLVAGNKKLSKKERRNWIEKGRKEYPVETNPTSKWKGTLANGVVVELLCVRGANGIWGADGSGIDYDPSFFSFQDSFSKSRKSRFDFAFRFNWPAGTNNSNIKFEVIGGGGGGSHGRGGRHEAFEVMVQELTFKDPVKENCG
ncbi:MAG: hypothetical protein ACYSWP_03190 [Planctomycetota bacterium]|jgi:hypothetical protein